MMEQNTMCVQRSDPWSKRSAGLEHLIYEFSTILKKEFYITTAHVKMLEGEEARDKGLKDNV